MTLHSPWFLVMMALLPAAWWWSRSARRRAAIVFSDVSRVRAADSGRRTRLREALPALRTAALALLIVAMARPQQGNEETRITSEGVAIQLVCDTSSSMNALDFELDGDPTDRISVVKKVVEDFVRGSDGLPGRPNDLIGLISFAHYADSICPLTLDHANLLNILRSLRAKGDLDTQRKLRELQLEYNRAQRGSGGSEAPLREIEYAVNLIRDEDGTGIGDAIGLGLERLDQATKEDRAAGKAAIKSRVMILMTDGKQTVPDSLDPVEAARIAAPLGIKIYTISVGRQDNVYVKRLHPLTGEVVLDNTVYEVDDETLMEIADATGGKFFKATDTESLRDIYAEIDKLERTRTDEKRYMQYTEKAGPWLLAAFVLLAMEVGLANTLLRKIP